MIRISRFAIDANAGSAIAMVEKHMKMVPVAIDIAGQKVELLDLRDATWCDPFFTETVDAWRRDRPDALSVSVTFDDLLALALRHRTPPAGFIFHTGRCGSTLLANMLMSSGQHLLIKEPETVSDLIAHWLNSEGEARLEAEALVAATIRCLNGAVSAAPYRVFKFAAWNVRMAGALLDLFPETPSVFIYRSPLETVASMLYQPPAWFGLIRCPRWLPKRFFPTLHEVPASTQLSPALLFSHAWKSAVEAALVQPPDRMLLLEYGEMTARPVHAIQRVLSHFQHAAGADQISLMASAAHTYSKDPTGSAVFQPGSTHRRPPLSSAEASEVHAAAGDAWARLEALRNSAVKEVQRCPSFM